MKRLWLTSQVPSRRTWIQTLHHLALLLCGEALPAFLRRQLMNQPHGHPSRYANVYGSDLPLRLQFSCLYQEWWMQQTRPWLLTQAMYCASPRPSRTLHRHRAPRPWMFEASNGKRLRIRTPVSGGQLIAGESYPWFHSIPLNFPTVSKKSTDCEGYHDTEAWRVYIGGHERQNKVCVISKSSTGGFASAFFLGWAVYLEDRRYRQLLKEHSQQESRGTKPQTAVWSSWDLSAQFQASSDWVLARFHMSGHHWGKLNSMPCFCGYLWRRGKTGKTTMLLYQAHLRVRPHRGAPCTLDMRVESRWYPILGYRLGAQANEGNTKNYRCRLYTWSLLSISCKDNSDSWLPRCSFSRDAAKAKPKNTMQQRMHLQRCCANKSRIIVHGLGRSAGRGGDRGILDFCITGSRAPKDVGMSKFWLDQDVTTRWPMVVVFGGGCFLKLVWLLPTTTLSSKVLRYKKQVLVHKSSCKHTILAPFKLYIVVGQV